MKLNKSLWEGWVQLNSGSDSLRVKSFKRHKEDEILLKISKNLLSKLSRINDLDEIFQILDKEELWHISLVYESSDVTVLKSDIIRSAPLFYSYSDEHLSVTDRLPFNSDYEIDQDSVFEMIDGNYVLGNRTVYMNIFGIEAAEIVIAKNGAVQSNRYFTYNVDQTPVIHDLSNLKENVNTLDSILLKIFKEAIESVPENGRIIVPLSGGHDSRIVVNYLYRLGYRNVICYTYGMPGNVESKFSKEVADALDYEWYFVEYTEKKWDELHQNGLFDKYIDFACNGISNPHLQDFLAVYELQKTGVLKPGDLFIPGHGLDMLTYNIDYSKYDGDVVENAIRRFNRRRKYKAEKKSVQYIGTLQIFEESGVPEEAFLDYLIWQERQAKFLINSFRGYEFFGYQARAVFWDSELVLFMLSVAKSLKLSREFMNRAESEKLLINKLKKIPYPKDRVVDSIKKKSRKKSRLPLFLRVLLLRLTGKKQFQDEGLNLIYNLKARSLKKLTGPFDLWPENAVNLIKKHFYRYPYQINHHYLTRMYTVKKIYEHKRDN
jgi:asparagine synthase (glutamine-hydrolysing)